MKLYKIKLVERVTKCGKGVDIQKSEKPFFLPHRSVIREYAESTKLRIVSETSAKASKNTVSLSECLETGPTLQNSFYDIIVRSQNETHHIVWRDTKGLLAN